MLVSLGSQARVSINVFASEVLVEVPASETAVVAKFLSALVKHKPALGWLDYRTSLPPLAEVRHCLSGRLVVAALSRHA